jgi:DNA polymerase-1
MTTKLQAPFVLVDGSSYLFRAFHALPPLTNSKGAPTGAVYGVINMLRKLILSYRPEHIAVVFDCKEKTFRHDMFPEYKANRAAMPEELAVQIKPLHDVIRAMGLPLIAIPGVEADDVIGTLAKQACDSGLHTIISTSDKDMAQLVDDKITLVNTMSGSVLDRAGVLAKFEVTPEQMIDYLSLVGDSVDNIPGVYKVGPKTAVKWLQTYNSLDQIIMHAAEIPGKVGENLRNTIPELPLYKELIKIKVDVPLTLHPRDLLRGKQDAATLKQLFADLEFRTWLKQLEELSPASPLAEADKEQETQKTGTYEIITDKTSFDFLVAKLSQASKFAIAVETTTANYMDAQLVGIALASTAGQAAYVPIAHVYEGAPQQLAIDYVLQKLQPLLENPRQLKIAHNLKYLIEVLANYDIKVAGINFDTMLASYVINSVSSRHNLDILSADHLNKTTISYEDIAGKGAKQIAFDKIAVDKAAEYSAEKVDVMLQLYEEFYAQLTQIPSLQSIFNDMEMQLVPVLAAMERHGVLLDVASLNTQSNEIGSHLHTLEQQAYLLAGQEFNLGSPKQLQEILFEKLQLPVIEKTPTGQPSTGEAVLQELAQSYELPKLLLEHRTLSKLKSTYTDKLPLQVNARTGRVHTSYQQAVTATGRLSSTDPNLQNIPIRNIEGKKIRAAFIAAPGYKIVSADYSQIELRIMAHLSGDKTLIDTFKQGLDVHRATAAEVFGVALDAVTDEQRRHSKAINFGLIYGMSAFGLAKQIDSDRATAEHYIETYFQRFPGVRVYMDSTRKLAAEQGYVETLYGRRLYLPDIRSSKVMLRRAAERAAINAPLQGAQSDIIKKAMIAIFNWLETEAPDAHMIMQVHDELVFEIPEAKVPEYSEKIRRFMSNAAHLHVFLDVGIGVGNNWDEAH